MIASRVQRGVLWSHNDHGDDARIFALSEEGEDLGIEKYIFDQFLMMFIVFIIKENLRT